MIIIILIPDVCITTAAPVVKTPMLANECKTLVVSGSACSIYGSYIRGSETHNGQPVWVHPHKWVIFLAGDGQWSICYNRAWDARVVYGTKKHHCPGHEDQKGWNYYNKHIMVQSDGSTLTIVDPNYKPTPKPPTPKPTDKPTDNPHGRSLYRHQREEKQGKHMETTEKRGRGCV